MRKYKVFLSALSIISIFLLISFAGISQVAINMDLSAPNASAMLDIKNTSKGILIPRMTQVQRDAIASPAEGLMIYQTNAQPGFYYNAGNPTAPVWQGVGGQSKTATQIALLQWYHPTSVFTTNSLPRAIAYDGKNMWITNKPPAGTDNVSRYDASGSVVGSSNPGTNSWAIAFDGANMWVVNNFLNGGVTKLNAATGAFVASYTCGDPSSIVFDGTNVWVTNTAHVTVTKINVTTGVSATYPAGNYPSSIAFDGTNIWITNGNTNVTKINGATGAVISDYPVGSINSYIAFDGINMWISAGPSTVLKLNLSGDIVDSYTVNDPGAKAFDGTDMWIINNSFNTVTRMNQAGTKVAVYPVGNNPVSLAFDGANMWVVSRDNTVTKIHR